jgi:GDP-L-fucose synthase
VGSAISRTLLADGDADLLTADRAELDLCDARTVNDFFATHRPERVFLAAAKVGGILANSTFPGDFIRENLAIQLNVLEAARRFEVEKLLFLGSSCIYPRNAAQPMQESALLSGPLEPTNEAYAVAKIAGIKMCQAYHTQWGCKFISVMPTNLYGPGDNFDLAGSHVLPALIRKFHEAKVQGQPTVEVWGSGRPRREFLHVDDLAEACVFLMEAWDEPDIINVGTGEDISIADLAELVRSEVGYDGRIVFDPEKPDGTPRKLLDVTRIHELGWRAKISLTEGIASTYDWYTSEAGPA